MKEWFEFLRSPLFVVGEQIITVGQLLLVPFVLVVGWLVIGVIVRISVRRMEANAVSADVVHLVRRVIYIVALTLLCFTVIDLLNLPLAAFAFVSGAVAIGVGFGAQNIINNFISGWILMWERPIRIGDFLEIADAKGTVEAINTRSTRIRRVDGVHMLIPNSALLENTVVNWTLIDRLARCTVRVGVAYGSPVREVEALFLQAVKDQPEALEEPKPVVIFEDLGDNALIFDAYFWVHATVDRDLRVIRSNTRFRLEETLREHNITVAFPQRDVHLDGTVRLEQSAGDS